MIVSIMQPAYLPWLGYFDRLLRSDLHIVLDNVPLGTPNKNNFITRNRIRRARGHSDTTWLSIPVAAGQHRTPIHEVVLAESLPWPARHAETLWHAYARAACSSEVRELVAHIRQLATPREPARLAPVLQHTTQWLRDRLAIATPTVHASTLDVQGAKGDLILALCQHVGASTYLSGPFGRDYLDHAAFAKAGIALAFHDYAHPVYSQEGQSFLPFLSVVDLLAHCGSASREVLHGAPAPNDGAA